MMHTKRRTYLWLGHALGALSAALLVGAAAGWLGGGAEVVAQRLGLPAPAASAVPLARAVGFFKGLLDVWPLPLVGWFVVRRRWEAAAAVWLVAVVFVPLADLVGGWLTTGAPSGLHLLYAAAMGGSGLAYTLHGREAGAAVAS